MAEQSAYQEPNLAEQDAVGEAPVHFSPTAQAVVEQAQDGDFPEEPPPVGIPELSAGVAPPAPSEPDKEVLLDDGALMQVASPQKAAHVSPGAARSEDLPMPPSPLPAELPPTPFVAVGQSASETGLRESGDAQDWHEPADWAVEPTLADLRETADAEQVATAPSYSAPLPPPCSPPRAEPAVTETGGPSASPTPQPPALADLVHGGGPPLPPSSAPYAPEGLPPMLPSAAGARDEGIVALSKNNGHGADRDSVEIEDSVVQSFSRSPHMRTLHSYSGKVVRHPCKFICLYFILMCALIGVCWRPFEVDTDFSSFIRADGEAMRRREAYMLALDEKKGLDGKRRLQDRTAGGESAEGEVAEATLPFADKAWWKALRRHDSEQTLGDQLSDEEEGMVHLDEEAQEALLHSEEPLLSLQHRSREDGGDSQHPGRRLASTFFIRHAFTVIYHSVKGDALSDRVLTDALDFESELFALKGWKRFCGELVQERAKSLCNPGESLVSYAYPTQVPSESSIKVFDMDFDGKGKTRLSKSAMLSYLQTRTTENQDLARFFPKTFTVPSMIGNATIAPPAALRTVFTFKIVVGTSAESMTNVRKTVAAYKEKYEEFIRNEVYPVLSSASFGDTNVFYYGDVITGYEVTKTLAGDSWFAFGSIIFVLFYLLFHTQSLLLSISCLGIIFASVPVAYVLTPASKTTIASFLSLFLITGVGSDVVFVFTDFWEQSRSLKKPNDIRIAWMLVHAGQSCFATSLTTSVSFFANLASVLQPLREFGLFMGLCVMSAFLLVCCFLPPLLIIVEGRSAPRVGIVDEALLDATSAEADEENPFSPKYNAKDPWAPKPPSGDLESAGGSPKSPKRRPREIDTSTSLQKQERARKPCVHSVLLFTAGKVSGCPGKILIFTGLLVIVFVIGVGSRAEMATGVPEIFPPEHNQVKAEEWAGKFHSVSMPKNPLSGSKGAACRVNRSSYQSPTIAEAPCVFHWCDAPSSEIEGAEDATWGNCWRSPVSVTSVDSPNTRRRQVQGNMIKAETLQHPWSTEECQRVTLSSRIAGPKHPQPQDWFRIIAPTFQQMANSSKLNIISMKADLMERLALENWESGQVSMTNFFDMGTVTAEPANWNKSQEFYRQCEIQTLCFFGAPKCGLEGWRALGKFSLSEAPMAPNRRLNEDEPHDYAAAERRLSSAHIDIPGQYTGPVLAPNKRTDVTVIFGVRAAVSTPLVGAPTEQWSFDPSFEPENPWAQRAMLAACMDAPEELMVISAHCWVGKWRSWLSSQGGRFPSRKFDSKVIEWMGTSVGMVVGSANIWLVKGKVKAAKIAFVVNFYKYAGAQEGLKYSKLWDKYVKNFNDAASISANRAFHSAALFVRAEAEIAVIESTLETIVISAVCGFLGMCIFTKDPWTSALVTSLVLGIISGLAFFMVVLMGWKIGPIEVISLVVFVGYSVTYSLHIAHNYVEVHTTDPECMRLEREFIVRERRKKARYARKHSGAEEEREEVNTEGDELTPAQNRRARTRMSMLHVGGATLSSAVSTMGSSMFLLFCTLNIFVKLGCVVIAVTSLSIVFALVALPALLMWVGPTEDSVCTRYGICVRSAAEKLPRSPLSSPSAARMQAKEFGSVSSSLESQPLVADQALATEPRPPEEIF